LVPRYGPPGGGTPTTTGTSRRGLPRPLPAGQVIGCAHRHRTVDTDPSAATSSSASLAPATAQSARSWLIAAVGPGLRRFELAAASSAFGRVEVDYLLASGTVEDHRFSARHGRRRAIRPPTRAGKRPDEPPVPPHGSIISFGPTAAAPRCTVMPLSASTREVTMRNRSGRPGQDPSRISGTVCHASSGARHRPTRCRRILSLRDQGRALRARRASRPARRETCGRRAGGRRAAPRPTPIPPARSRADRGRVCIQLASGPALPAGDPSTAAAPTQGRPPDVAMRWLRHP
jgi:hypothetical protein